MKTLLPLFVLLLAAGPAPVSAADAEAKIGAPAPAFSLIDSTGKARRLADFKGKVVVLEWYNNDCPYVKKHYESGNMPKLQKKFTGKGAVWLSIISSAEGKQGHVTGPEAESNKKKAGAAPTHVLFDPTGATGRAYGAKTTPHMYVVDTKGILRYNGAIDSVPSADQSDIADARSYITEAADAVLAGRAVGNPVTKPYGCSVKYKN